MRRCDGHENERWSFRIRAGLRSSVMFAVGCALVILTTSTVSSSQSRPIIELQWEAPLPCPQGDSVQDRIRGLVGGTEVPPDRLRAEGRITRSGERYSLTLIVKSGSVAGIRTLQSESCEHLASASAIALGLLVRLARTTTDELTTEDLGAAPAQSVEPSVAQPPSGLGHEPHMPSSVDTAAHSTSTSTADETPPIGTREPRVHVSTSDAVVTNRNFRVLLRAPSLELSLGSLPGLSAGYAIGAGASYRGWKVLLSGTLWPRRTISSAWPGFGAEVACRSVAFDGCRSFRTGRFEWAPCLRAGFVHIVANGTGPGIAPLNPTTSVWSAGAALDSKFYWAPWAALFLAVGADLPTSRPRLVTKELGELYRFPALILRLDLGVEWIF